MTTAQESATYAGAIVEAELGLGGSCNEGLNDLVVDVFIKAMDAVDGRHTDRDLGEYLPDEDFDRLREQITGEIVNAVYQAKLTYVAHPEAVAS